MDEFAQEDYQRRWAEKLAGETPPDISPAAERYHGMIDNWLTDFLRGEIGRSKKL